MLRELLLVATALFCAVSAVFSAPMKVEKEEKRIVSALPCGDRTNCAQDANLPRTLKEFGFWVQEYSIPKKKDDAGDNEVRNTRLYAWYEALVPSAIEDYAFVQYVRGCVFSSERAPDGKVVTHLSVTRQHLGERHVFVHPDWEVDSDSPDPLFGTSGTRVPRHYFMEWNNTPNRFPEEKGKYYGEDPPRKTTRLHVRSLTWPPAYIGGDGIALNHSLEYRMCLYRTSDIPMTAPKGFIPDALACQTWNVSHVYDFEAKTFTSPAEIVAACRVDKKPDPNKPW